jgi:hypothetical protein
VDEERELLKPRPVAENKEKDAYYAITPVYLS